MSALSSSISEGQDLPVRANDRPPLHPNQLNVHPLASGVWWREWLMTQIHRQAEEYLKTRDSKDVPLSNRPIATARDSYGMKSI